MTMRRRLLAGVSVLAFGVAAMAGTRVAGAATTTIPGSTTTTATQTIAGTDTLINNGVISAGGNVAVVITGAGTLTNSNQITSTNAVAAVTILGAGASIGNSSQIVGSAAGAAAISGNIGFNAGTIVNSGIITGGSQGIDVDSADLIANTGKIVAAGSGILVANTITGGLSVTGTILFGQGNISGSAGTAVSGITIGGASGNIVGNGVSIGGLIQGPSSVTLSGSGATKDFIIGVAIGNTANPGGTIIGSVISAANVTFPSSVTVTGGTVQGGAIGLFGNVTGDVSITGTLGGTVAANVTSGGMARFVGLYAKGNIAGNIVNTGNVVAMLTNSGSGSIAAAHGSGIAVTGTVGGTFANTGNIVALNTGVTIGGKLGGDLSNTGTIIAGNTALAVGGAVAGNVINGGNIVSRSGYGISIGGFVGGGLTNTGSISAAGYGIIVGGSVGGSVTTAGTIAFGQSTLISGTIAGLYVGASSGNILTGGATLGGLISGPASGNIAASGNVLVSGVAFGASGGTGTVQGSIVSSGTISPPINLSIVNSGAFATLIGLAVNGDLNGSLSITGGTIGGSITGNIAGGATLSALGIRVSGNVTGNIVNAGTIRMQGNIAGAGLFKSVGLGVLGNVAGNLTNTGTIAASNIAVYLGSVGGTITNSGMIAGRATALNVAAGNIAIFNTGTFSGNIIDTIGTVVFGGSGGIYGDLTGGNISAEGVLFASGGAPQILADSVNVGASGTVVNNGTVEVDTPITITGNYRQASTGILQIGVSSVTAGGYGEILATGDANIASGGTIQIVPLTANALSSTSSATLTILGGLTGSFGNVTVLPSLLDTISTGSIFAGGNSYLTATVAPQTFNSGAGSGVAQNLASVLTGLAGGSATSDQFLPVATKIEEIERASGNQAAANAISLLAPGAASEQISSSFGLTDLVSNAIGQEMGGIDVAAEDSNGVIGRSAGASEGDEGALWGRVVGASSSGDSTSGFNGFTASSFGLVVGADTSFTPSFRGGLALSLAHGSTTGTQLASGQSGSVGSYQLTGYGSWNRGQFQVNGQLGAGFDEFSEQRNLSTLGLGTAKGTYNGLQLLGGLEAGYAIPAGRLTFTPFAGLRYLDLSNAKYVESGAGAGDLSVNAASYSSLESTAGLSSAWNIQAYRGNFLPQVKLSWLHDLQPGTWKTTSSLGGTAFTAPSTRPASEGLGVNLSISFIDFNYTSMKLEYEGDLRSNYKSNSGFLEWKQAF